MTRETMWVVGSLVWLFTLGSAILYFLGIKRIRKIGRTVEAD